MSFIMGQKQTDTSTIVLSPPIYIFQLYVSPKIDKVLCPPTYNPTLILKCRFIFQLSMRNLLMSHKHITNWIHLKWSSLFTPSTWLSAWIPLTLLWVPSFNPLPKPENFPQIQRFKNLVNQWISLKSDPLNTSVPLPSFHSFISHRF